MQRDNDQNEDQYIEVEEYVEVISTDDERIKIIGEELGNDTGRAIFTTLSKGITSPNELSKILGVSLPLINWHIRRLMQVGLVRVEELKMSPKNRPVKYYGPAKTVLVIVPPESDEAGPDRRSKFDLILSKFSRNIVTAVSFISGASVIYAAMQFLAAGSGPGVMLADPGAIAATASGSDMAVAVLGGAAIGAAVWLSSRLARRRNAA